MCAKRIQLALGGIIAIAIGLSACDKPEAPPAATAESTPAATSPAPTPAPPAPMAEGPTKLLWGDTHLHTNYSPDAYFMENKTAGPDVAYKWAKGLPVSHPYTKAKVQIGTPLDFLMVTDHAEYMGVIQKLFAGHPLLKDTESGKKYMQMAQEGKGKEVFFKVIDDVTSNRADPDLDNLEVRTTNWQEIYKIADEFNEPGKFTAFIGWEWSSLPNGANLHRIIFMPEDGKTAGKFVPYSSFDSENPEDLWAWLEKTGKESGANFVAIPHNSNISGGLMFPAEKFDGKPVDSSYAQARMKWEPVIEVTQIKGDSETHPNLSPSDEFADFETYEHVISSGGGKATADNGDYARSGLVRGLGIEARTGANPYKYGMVGSTDSHTSLSSAEETNFWGKMALDSTPENKSKEIIPGATGYDMSASGLAAVWAEENTRESIAAAFKRKEVYASSGPRIQVRFYGGWEYQAADAEAPNLAKLGYDKGVPMGGDLTSAPEGKAPTFLLHAAKDPKDANLDRIQVVKGWYKNGQKYEKIYDVSWSGDRKIGDNGKLPSVGNTVNIKDATYSNDIGAPQLATAWSDPDFDPAARAFYYVRVLQIPTPRHTLYDAIALGVPHPENHPATIQERAYTSPIWYTPSEELMAKAEGEALTVAGLKAQGKQPLNDAQLKALIVGKTFTVKNLPTGELFEASYLANGKRILQSKMGDELSYAQIWQAMHGGAPMDGIAPYEIKNGKIVTTFNNQTFEVIVFNVDGRHVAARSNEAGYANYEVVASN